MQLVITSPLARSIQLSDMKARPALTKIIRHRHVSLTAFRLRWALTNWNDELMDFVSYRLPEQEP